MKWHYNRTFGSALIVGGTAIGAGMLGLPSATGSFGFWIASSVFLGLFSVHAPEFVFSSRGNSALQQRGRRFDFDG